MILDTPKNIVNGMYNSWERAFELLHGVPSERPTLLQIIGTDGVELFQLNNTLTTFMISQLSGVRNDIVESIQETINTLPNFIYNQNGSVTEVLVTPPTASSIVYGQSLSSSTLTGGSADISGTFSTFASPSFKPNVGLAYYDINFIPTDTTKFKITTHLVPVEVLPANLPSVTFTPPDNLVYDGQPKPIQYTVADSAIVTASYTGSNNTDYLSNNAPTAVGDYILTVTSADPNYIGFQSYNYSITAA
jgi:hypothetical protein